MKNFFTVLLCICAMAFSAYYFYHSDYYHSSSLPGAREAAGVPQPPPPELTTRSLDVDAIAARMKEHQDVYKRLRDGALKVYASRLPAGKFDGINSQEIRTAASLWVWDDFYQEGLSQAFDGNAQSESSLPLARQDPLIRSVAFTDYYMTHHYLYDSDYVENKAVVDNMEASDYPIEFKMSSWAQLAGVISVSSSYADVRGSIPQSLAALPGAVEKTASYYQQLIKNGLPDKLLAAKGIQFLEAVEDNETALKLMGDGLDKAFAAEAPDSPARAAVQGNFLIDYAWNARGYGFANTITAQGQRLMDERLQQAADLLEAAYVKHPEFADISCAMMSVELGQGQGSARMETWFQRAIKAGPARYDVYRSKAYYLEPRWYGSEEIDWQFGMECVRTQDWQDKIPMVLARVAEDIAQQRPGDLSDPQVWEPLEKVFRTWLDHYPQSTIYRSKFVKYAALGKHWAVVKEQCAILGNDWDRDVFKGMNYQQLKQTAARKTGNL